MKRDQLATALAAADPGEPGSPELRAKLEAVVHAQRVQSFRALADADPARREENARRRALVGPHQPQEAFVAARWRGTTLVNPCRGGVIGLSLDLKDGSVGRFALSVEAAEDVIATLGEAIDRYRAKMGVQSEMSSGSPNSVASPQDGV